MGQPKMLLPWGTTTIFGHLMSQWQQIGAAQVAAVCGASDEALEAELDRIHFPRRQRIMNPEPARGMFSSVQCAARWPYWNPSLTHWAIVLGDQPQLAESTVRSVAAFAADNPDAICQPGRAGRPRHPVFLSRRGFQALASANHQTLKEFLAEHASEMRVMEINDPALDFDIDTPADYDEARRRFPT